MQVWKWLGIAAVAGSPAMLMAGNPYFLNFQVDPDPAAGANGVVATQNAGVTVVRDQVSGQAAYEMAGPDGPGVGRIFSSAIGASYVLTDIGSQFSSALTADQTLLSVVECFSGQFGWSGPAYAAAESNAVTRASIIGGRLIGSALLLSQVPVPSLIQASPSHISVQIPVYRDDGGQATGLQLWRQGSDAVWQPLAQLGLTSSAQAYVDASVTAAASYWYGVSVIYSWPGGSGAGGLPALVGSYVSQARAISGLMVAAIAQPSPTAVPTLVPLVNHDLGQAGWAAGPNPSRDGHFRIQFKTTKAAAWSLSAFGLDGSLARRFSGTVSQAGWQLADLELAKQASGIYLLELRVTQEGESEKTLPIDKLAIIR